MKKSKTLWLTGGIIVVVLLVFGVLWLFPSTKALTEEELKAVAQSKYPGEILHMTKIDDVYEIEMQMENGIYTIKMDTKNGHIISLEQNMPEEVAIGKTLSESQIKEKIAMQGDLQSIQLVNQTENPYYEAVVKKENVETTLKVNPNNGEIIEATEVLQESEIPEKHILLTEQEALVIAATHLKGSADEDAELHHPSGQTPYYLVEVEIENGEEEDREAVVQIDAYTGIVKSVNWED